MKTVFEAEHILFDTESTTKEQAFAFIAANAHAFGYVADAKAFETGLNGREQHGSTGLTDGVAIPHCKHDTVLHAGIFVARFSHPIEWETMDEKPVTTAVSLTIPAEGSEESLRLLAKLSRSMMRKPFRDTLQNGDAGQVQDVIASAMA